MAQIILGKSGYGKTTYAKKIAGKNYIFLDIEKFAGIGYGNFKQNSFYILEDLDTYESQRNIIPRVKHTIKTLGKWLIITCHKDHHRKFKPILKLCRVHTLTKPATDLILKLMPNNNLSLVQKKNIIRLADGDIRHSILQATLYTGSINKKPIKSNIFDVVNMIMTKNLSLQLRSELFFFDYRVAGIILHENYMHKIKFKRSKEAMKQLANYADDLSLADIMETTIKQVFDYSALPFVADLYVGKITPFSDLSFLKFTSFTSKKKFCWET